MGFLTITFPDNVTDHKEAYRRFRSFNSNYFAKHESFGEWVHVKERQKRGAWHYHMIVVLKGDIRSGVNWEELAKGNYRSANPFLRSLWKDLRENLENYGLGRSELLPIRSNEEAMARYVGKYISKHMDQREEDDKGVRLVNYSRGWSGRNSVNFAWNTHGSHEWRRKLEKFAKSLGCEEIYQLSEKLGPGWAWKYLDDIMAIDNTLFERGIYCHHENRENIVPEFESSTVKKIILARKKKEIAKSNPSFNENKWLSGERKKKESKEYMGKLTQGYIEEWLAPDRMESVYRSVKYRFLESGQVFAENGENTGEIVPF